MNLSLVNFSFYRNTNNSLPSILSVCVKTKRKKKSKKYEYKTKQTKKRHKIQIRHFNEL